MSEADSTQLTFWETGPVTKTCRCCHKSKPLSNFRLRRDRLRSAYCESCHQVRVREYAIKHPERTYRQKRAFQLRRDYELTMQEYDQLLASQNGVCAICHQQEVVKAVKTGAVLPLSVDHDHTTGAVRALLCQACNTMLAKAKDNPSILRTAADYLEKHRHVTPTGELPSDFSS